MNNAQFADIIRIECKKKNIKLGELLEKCELNKGFISDLSRKNKTPSAESVIKIANFLNISTDYLLGRNAEPTQTINNQESNKGIQAHTYNAGAEERKLDDVSEELLKEFKKLSLKDKGEAIRIICEMAEKEK